MKDFTLNMYSGMLEALGQKGYRFVAFREWCAQKPDGKFVILRHDIDKNPRNALQMAKIEAGYGIFSSYYFQIKTSVFKPDIIREIERLGHEVGYHYRDFAVSKGDYIRAIASFEKNLSLIRSVANVNTMTMDGSPLSVYDNRKLWKKYNYTDYGIIGEPYFDIDFNKIFYLTDTGRCWNGDKYSIRDKVETLFTLSYHHTQDIINAANKNLFPEQVMITTHPQRWTENRFEWLMEWGMQSVKNIIKRYILLNRK